MNQIKSKVKVFARVLYKRRRKVLQIEENLNIAFSGRKTPRRDDKQTRRLLTEEDFQRRITNDKRKKIP